MEEFEVGEWSYALLSEKLVDAYKLKKLSQCFLGREKSILKKNGESH